MTDIEDFVSVTVNRETRALSVKSFSTPLILAHHTHYLDRVREYAQADDLLDDGFAITDKVYRDALAIKSQNPAPATFKVGRRALPDTQVVHILPLDLTVGLVHSLWIDDELYEVTNPPGATVATVADAIVAATASAVGVTVTDGSTHAIATASAAGAVHRFRVSSGLRLLDATANAGVVTDLTAIREADQDWYGLALDNYSSVVIAAAAAWVEAQPIVMALQSADWNVLDSGVTTDIASLLAAASYTRMWGTWKGELGGSFAAAWLGRTLAVNPGRENPAHKTIVGQSADALSTSQRTAALAKRFSLYERTAGVSHTFEGKTPSNEFIDQVIGSDWLKFRMQEAVFSVFLNNGNVPQTNVGIGLVETGVWDVLKRGSSAAFPILDPTSLSVSAPDIADVPSADKLARTLPDIVWRARFQGSFNRAKPITGFISV